MPKYFEPDTEVLRLAEELIAEYHDSLQDCNIAFLMADTAPKRNGKVAYGWAKKIPADMQQFVDYDFLIVLAWDMWVTLTPAQRRALVDHELCHCDWDAIEDKASLRGHDIEEFVCIIERHGLWMPVVEQVGRAIQPHLPLEVEPPKRNGKVMAAQLPADMLAQME